MAGYEIIKINHDTWRIEDGHVRFFLLCGSQKAMLIDSGMTIPNVGEIARSLTDLPIELINTHADRDHVNGNGDFDRIYMNPSECSNYYKIAGRTEAIIPVYEGDIFDLGGRILEVIALPGHTPGSIAILDTRDRILFSGDPIQNGNIFMFGIQRELHGYIHSLKKIMKMGDRFDEIYPSHGSVPVTKDIFPKLLEIASGILEDKYDRVEEEVMGNVIDVVRTDVCTFLLDRK